MQDNKNCALLTELLEDRDISVVDALNNSGILKDINGEDVAAVIHAADILRSADDGFLKEVKKAFF
jgi:hypothetical protein